MKNEGIGKGSEKKALKIHSFVAVIKNPSEKHERLAQGIKPSPYGKTYYYSSEDNTLEIVFALRKNENNLSGLPLEDYAGLLLGDDSEWKGTQGQKCMAYGAFIECDLKKKNISVLSSIVGLPPVFIYKDPSFTIITSDIYLLSSLPELKLHFDPQGIIETCSIGHPIGHKTLFRDITVMPAGFLLKVSDGRAVSMERSWFLPEIEPSKDWDTFTNLQIETFKHAIKDLDLSNSFISLTAGLDTRAILAELIHENRIIPAYTMSGQTLSLDARTAKKLSSVYGIRHGITIIENDFYKDFPDYTIEASRLSGGLASIEQASEVYFYKKTNGSFNARLSGNLGNQIGRRGTEKVSLRNADAAILDESIYKKVKESSAEHWYRDANVTAGRLDYEFLLQNEVPFSSVGNYCIGNYFTIQQSPYANYLLIENSFRMPADKNAGESLSLIQLRLNDLRHRFLGEPESHSFQRKLIKATGGYVASCPINWGWRAKGGVSLPGLCWGMLTFLDAIAASKGLNSGVSGKGLKFLNITGLHEFRYYDAWMKSFMKEFIYDTLLSDSIKASGLFNIKRLEKMVEEHYSYQRDHHKALVFALDIAVAKEAFNAAL